MEKYGEQQAALELSRQIWVERGASEAEVGLFTEAMNIQGKNIASFFKHLQIDPGVGSERLQKHICEELDMPGYAWA